MDAELPLPEDPSTIKWYAGSDVDALDKQGTFRILLQRFSEDETPNDHDVLSQQRAIATTFARDMGWTPEYVYVDTFDQLIPALLEHRGDVIIANMTVTEARKKSVAFTVPIALVNEQIVARKSVPTPLSLSELDEKILGVQRGTTFYKTAEKLLGELPGLHIEILDAAYDSDRMLQAVENEEVDLVIEDSNYLHAYIKNHDNVKAIWTMEPAKDVAWAVRTDSTELLTILNRYLYQVMEDMDAGSTFTSDWPQIQELGSIRFLLHNSLGSYFIWKGESMGYEYELARYFAQSNNVLLEPIAVPSRNDIIPLLLQGKGDVGAAMLPITPEALAQGIAFAGPYYYADGCLIVNKDAGELHDLADLAGRSITVKKNSRYWNTLTAVKAKNSLDFTIEAVPEDTTTDELIDDVATGTRYATIIDSHKLDHVLTYHNDIQSPFTVGDPHPYGWAVRRSNPILLAQLDAFFAKEIRGLFFNMTYKKYFKNKQWANNDVTQNTGNPLQSSSLTPYDCIIQKYANKYQFDWRLIASQIVQESRCDPNAVSWDGAEGLMQLMPETAKQLGFNSVRRPDQGIHAGIKYMDYLRSQFSGIDLLESEKVWFILAAYNAGIGHVYDAIDLARREGMNPHLWADNVERAMLQLSSRTYANAAQYGYVRGSEPVNYVKEIKTRYTTYKQACPTTSSDVQSPTTK
ncbi:MAG: transporter substrate-binding domain-containing protein [Spartobacteria bacterium]|nr:transporter substrate-binding domain-containing protein [Spartobacteria bacterium]